MNNTKNQRLKKKKGKKEEAEFIQYKNTGKNLKSIALILKILFKITFLLRERGKTFEGC